jgi:hypothetical protein
VCFIYMYIEREQTGILQQAYVMEHPVVEAVQELAPVVHAEDFGLFVSLHLCVYVLINYIATLGRHHRG